MILGCWDEEKFLLLLLISIKGPYTWSPFAWIGVLLRSVSVRNTPRWIYMGRIKTSCSAKMYRESPGTSRVTWIRGDASRILAVYHPSEIKLSHPSEIKSSYPCKQVPCKWWPRLVVVTCDYLFWLSKERNYCYQQRVYLLTLYLRAWKLFE